MKVVVLPSLIAPVAEGRCFGGAEMAALALAEGVAERGHHVTLFGLAGSGGAGLATWIAPYDTPLLRPLDAPSDRPAASVEELSSPSLVRAALLAPSSPFEPVERELLARIRAGELDVLHLHLIDVAALRLADLLARAYPALRVVATLHVAAVFPETAALVRRLWAEGTPVVFTAPSRAALESYGIEPDGHRAHVVPNGIDPSRIPFAPVAPKDGRLAWAGRRSREKGLLEALAIARRTRRPISIAGAPAPEATDADRRALEEAMALAEVDDLGLLARSEVPRLFARAEVTLVTSSIPETHSLVAIESLASGTPVVAFEVGALAEVIEPGVTGVLVQPGDVDAACAALADVPQLSRAECRQAALTRFHHARVVDRFLAVYA